MLKVPEIGDTIKVIQAEAGAHGANGKTGVVTDERSTNGVSYGIKMKMDNGDVWAIGHLSRIQIQLVEGSKSGKPAYKENKSMRKEIEALDVEQLLSYIAIHEKHDDYRDMFQSIHNWGYNTDFTYNDITNPDNHSVKEYLVEYIMEDEEEE